MKKRFANVVMLAASLVLSASLAFAVEVKVDAPEATGAAKAAKSAGDKTKASAAAAKGAAADTKAGAKAAVTDTKAGAKAAVADTKASATAAKDKAKGAAADTKAAAKGKIVDINTATDAELKAIPGVGDTYASKIIAGRPYANKSQLKSRNILPEPVYEQVKGLIIAKKVKK